jgi:hypothetical protein
MQNEKVAKHWWVHQHDLSDEPWDDPDHQAVEVVPVSVRAERDRYREALERIATEERRLAPYGSWAEGVARKALNGES